MKSGARLTVGVVFAACLAALVGPSGLHALKPSGLQAPTPPSPQPQQQPPVFRGGVNVVYVDVYPRRDGKVIDDLKQEDFEVFEDGKPQPVQTFEFIRTEPVTPDAERRDPTSQQQGDQWAADPHNRVFVIVIDKWHIGGMWGAREIHRPVMNFLQHAIGPTDVFAVMTPDSMVGQMVFARSLDTIEQDLLRLRDFAVKGYTGEPTDGVEAQMWACWGREGAAPIIEARRRELLMTLLENLMRKLGGLRDERKNIVLVSGFFAIRPDRPINMAPTMGPPQAAIPQVGVGLGGRLGMGNDRTGSSNDDVCYKLANAFSNPRFDDRFRRLVGDAQRANVTFYAIDPNGLSTAMPVRDGQTTTAVDALKTLAENTDGLAIVDTNSFDNGIKQMNEATAGYYLLGYASANTRLDGAYHRIEVKVKRPKVDVAARHGYYATNAAADAKLEAAAAARAANTPKAPPAVTDALAALADLRFGEELFTTAASVSGDAVDVVVELASRQMATGAWSNGADVTVGVGSNRASPIASARGRIEPGARGVRVRVPVTLPAAADGAPLMAFATVTGAGRPLEAQTTIAPQASGAIGSPSLYRGGVSPRAIMRPAAERLFARTERLRVEWPIAVPVSQRSARVLDRQGQATPITIAVGEAAADAATGAPARLTIDLPLAPFADADYVLELSAGAGDASVRSFVAFRVVR